MGRRRRYYTVEVDREITFRHTHRILAFSEERAKEIAVVRVREGDWFGGDVVNDWITRRSLAPPTPAPAPRAPAAEPTP